MSPFPLNRRRLRPVLFVTLFLMTLLAVACAPGTPPPPLSTAMPVPSPSAPTQPAGQATDVPMGVDAEGSFYRGNPDATVKIEEFSDFQCPFCARHVAQTEPALRERYIATGQVVHVFRHFPLTQIHPLAVPAAKAAYCAGQQAPALFWQMHDWLFANQNTWNQATDAAAQFRQAALNFGADGATLDTCLADPATEARIQRDLDEGINRGVQGTPSFFINNWFISGAYPLAEFQDKIEKAQLGMSPPPTPTPLPLGVQFFDLDPARPGFTYDGSPSLGAPAARLILISFEDFKSTDSAQYATTVEPALKSRFVANDQIRLVFKFFPDTAPKAAVAALCAARQGKFWEFRDLLYAEQAAWQEGDTAAMDRYAGQVGLDGSAFANCLTDEKAQNEVETAYRFGQTQIGVPMAPSFLLIKLAAPGQIEDVKGFPGLQSLDSFQTTIEELLKPQAQVPTPSGPISAEKLASLSVGMDADGNFYRGDPAAPLRLIDFSDFQCPFCARHAVQTAPLLDEMYVATGKVVHVFRHLPLEGIHPNAIPAAKAAYCAGQQGPKLFWALHDWLFANQNTWGSARDAADQFRRQALALGADAGRYDACITAPQAAAAIQRDLDEATRLGIRSTPTFILQRTGGGTKLQGDEERVIGALPYLDFAKKIEALLAAQGATN
ncbi:MAG: thioredoxin domain-containing protein [Anaerolineae bacterium]